MKPIQLLAAVAIVSIAVPAQSAQSVRAGIDAWQRGEFMSAVSIWKPLAQKGDADAAFNLGQAYRLGRGVSVDLATAQGWLERAARKGHLDAQTTLGLLLFDSGNRTGGMRWLKQAAERGETRALLVYGTALFNGDGVARDPVLAYSYVSRAAAQGLEPAKQTLADMDSILPVEQRQKGVALALTQKDKKTAAPAKKPTPAASPKAEPAKATPVKSAAAPSAAASSASGPWRIQLGAFSQKASAEALYRRVSGQSAISGKRPFYVAAGAITRLQIGPFANRSAATEACESLKGQACFAVEAR